MRSWTIAGPVLSGLLAGCLSPISLDRAVMAYDDVATRLVSQQLLLNIARARNHHPIHFTGISSIVATFNYEASLGTGTPLLLTSGKTVIPPFASTTISENPTFSIVPIEGEAFTQRLLTPIPQDRLTMLLRQGTEVDVALRLLASEFRTSSQGRTVICFNRPGHHNYEVFRQIVLHLSSIQHRQALYLEPLHFRQTWEFPLASVSPANLTSLLQNFSVQTDSKERRFQLSRQVSGRIIITNYDPSDLSNEQRVRLNEEAERSAPDELLVDVRPSHAGGEYSFRGRFRIRSFRNVLDFIGRGIAEEPEYAVPPDRRTPATIRNPVHTLEIIESERSISPSDLTIKYNDRHYAVAVEHDPQWNRDAFRLLAQLFQMTMTDISQSTSPGISIAK